jgi:hypothetical protein
MGARLGWITKRVSISSHITWGDIERSLVEDALTKEGPSQGSIEEFVTKSHPIPDVLPDSLPIFCSDSFTKL